MLRSHVKKKIYIYIPYGMDLFFCAFLVLLAIKSIVVSSSLCEVLKEIHDQVQYRYDVKAPSVPVYVH